MSSGEHQDLSALALRECTANAPRDHVPPRGFSVARSAVAPRHGFERRVTLVT